MKIYIYIYISYFSYFKIYNIFYIGEIVGVIPSLTSDLEFES